MADDPPLSTSVPETTTVDLGVDKEQLGNLNEAFDDFWKGEDEKAGAPPEAPPAPTEGPGQETREAKAETKQLPTETKQPKPETKPAQAETLPEPGPKELSDDEISKLELPPNARPELIEQFRVVKENWMADRTRARGLKQQLETLNTQLAEARQNAWTPEIKADYEHAAGIRRRFDFVSDPDFLQRFHTPIRAQYESILNEAVGMLPERQSAIQWAQYMLQNYNPDQLNRDWWVQSVLNKVPNEMDRTALRDSISELLKLQKDRDTEITRRTQDKSSFDNWIQEKAQWTEKRVREEIMSEIGEQEKRVQEILPRDIAQAKTTDERRAIEAHNERFTKLNTYFQDRVKDISANGPRAWVRVSVEATRALMLGERVTELESELKNLKTERDQLQADLDKIHGARRKLTQSTTGTPVVSGDKKNNNQGLSIKSLDVRKAFDDFDWGDRST